MKKAVDKLGDPHRRVIIGRCAILTKPIHQATPDARAACHWCGHCDRDAQPSLTIVVRHLRFPLLREPDE